MKRFAMTTLLLAGLTATAAWAQDPAVQDTGSSDPRDNDGVTAIQNRFYISPMGSHTWEDNKRQTDAAWGGALGIGKQFNSFLSVELSAFYSQFHTYHDLDSLDMTGYGLNALVFPIPSFALYGILGVHGGEGKHHPVVTPAVPGGLLGLGGSPRILDERNYKTTFGDAGLGYLFGPFSGLNGGSLRAEVRYRMDFHDKSDLGEGGEDDFGDVVANFGFLIPIGATAAREVPPPPPAPVEVVPAAPPADSDGDGVPDDLDQCPGTPAGTPVNDVGCPLPSKCKTPEPGQPVTLEGCAAGDVVVLRGVNFEFDKARLTTNARSILDGVGDSLIAAPEVKVEIGGHTDAKGTDEYNLKLSDRRAASVVQYLVGKGVEPTRMTSKGYGEAMPVADNETDEGRELNRRVELKVTEGSATVAPVVPPAAAAAPAAEPAPAADAAPAPAADAAAPAADAVLVETPPPG